MEGRFKKTAAAAMALFAFAGNGVAAPTPAQSAVKPAGGRMLGMHTTPAQDNDFQRAFLRARGIGTQFMTLAINWNDVETAPGKYTDHYLGIANLFYPPRKMPLLLILRPIDTNRKQLPADLQNRNLDDPEVIERFKKMLDYVFRQIPQVELYALAIGNEVDVYLGANAALWRQYRAFYAATKAHAKKIRPRVPVGVTATFGGATTFSKEPLKAVNALSDLVMITYYPLQSDFTVRDPGVVHADFDRVLSLYPGRPVIFTEAGYPSSPDCSSSEEKQAAFVRNIFRAWDAHADQIRGVAFLWLHDISPESVATLTSYYGLHARGFRGYLSSLGMRTYPGVGRDKPAFAALAEEAKARGWR